MNLTFSDTAPLLGSKDMIRRIVKLIARAERRAI